MASKRDQSRITVVSKEAKVAFFHQYIEQASARSWEVIMSIIVKIFIVLYLSYDDPMAKVCIIMKCF